jgi:hypothetical protein
MSIFEKALKTFEKNVFSLHKINLRSRDNLFFFEFVSIIFYYLF